MQKKKTPKKHKSYEGILVNPDPVALYAIQTIKKRVETETFNKAFLLVTAYLMDEFDYDASRIGDMWDGIARYSEAIDSHLISLEKVGEIITEHTGIETKW